MPVDAYELNFDYINTPQEKMHARWYSQHKNKLRCYTVNLLSALYIQEKLRSWIISCINNNIIHNAEFMYTSS